MMNTAESVSIDDTKSLSRLKTIAGNQFKRGFVIYTGTESIPLGTNIRAMPVAWLNTLMVSY